MPCHPNAKTHIATWRRNHKEQYNEYIKNQMRKFRIWKKIQMEFLCILYDLPEGRTRV